MKSGETYTVKEMTELASRVVHFISEDLGPLPIGVVRFIGNEIVLYAETQLTKAYLKEILKEKQRLDDLQVMLRSQGGGKVDRV